MKKLFLILVFLCFMADMSYADPFFTCDPQAGVTVYRIDGQTIAAEPDGSIRWDVGALTSGTHNLTLEAGWEYTIDSVPQGVYKWSDPVPFVLGVPLKPSSSTGLTIVP